MTDSIKLDNFIVDFSEKKLKKQLDELKLLIVDSLEYFRKLYINIGENTDDVLEEKHKLVTTEGYIFMLKIHTMLEIIHINDTSQTNKYKYEECIHSLINISNFINMFNGIIDDEFKDQTIQITDKSKIQQMKDGIEKNNLIEQINILNNKKNKFNVNCSINIFNHYINELVLQLCKIKLVLKNTHIDH